MDRRSIEVSIEAEERKLDRNESIEDLSAKQRAQKFSSIDQGSIEVSIKAEERKLDRNESIDDLSRSCWAWRKGVFQRREKHVEMNATSKLLKHRSKQHIKLSKHLSTYMQSIHTHTHTTSLTNFIFQK